MCTSAEKELMYTLIITPRSATIANWQDNTQCTTELAYWVHDTGLYDDINYGFIESSLSSLSGTIVVMVVQIDNRVNLMTNKKWAGEACGYDCQIAQILFLKYQPCNMYYPPSFCIIHQLICIIHQLVCIIYQVTCIIYQNLYYLPTLVYYPPPQSIIHQLSCIIHQLKFYYPPTPVTQISQCRVCRSRLMFKLIFESALWDSK